MSKRWSVFITGNQRFAKRHFLSYFYRFSINNPIFFHIEIQSTDRMIYMSDIRHPTNHKTTRMDISFPVEKKVVLLHPEMSEQEIYYVDVLLPLHLPEYYTYRVPQEYNGKIEVGMRVVVQFGRQRLYSALVRQVHTHAPQWKAKYIMSVLDVEPIVTEDQMVFWEWLARYYMCYPGDVMAVALPSGMKLASESAVAIHPDYDGELSQLGKYEVQVVQLLSEQRVMKVNDLSKAIGVMKIMPLIRGMIERSIIVMDEEISNYYRPKTSTYVRLADQYQSDQSLQLLFDQLEKKKYTKQVEVLLQLIQQTQNKSDAIAKRLLPQGSAINTLLKNGIFVAEEHTESRIEDYGDDQIVDPSSIVLNEEQQAAYDTISNDKVHNVCLLHGVTSSGKTEIYVRLAHDVMQQGGQVLFLLPEIALTTQVINRLKRYFGSSVGVYHSRFTPNQRVEVWKRTHSSEADRLQIILGARSALLLPFNNLQLIIVDEEHDTSYKQQEPAPRYHARDAAIWLASHCGAKVVLGSATPSVESYYNAMTSKYGFASIMQRYGGYQLPQIEVVDMGKAHHEKQMHGNFSQTLLDAIDDALMKHEQVILFQNRRGFSLHLECDECHNTMQCIHCDVSLVYHKATQSLRCHYCGYSIPVPSECPACHSSRLRMVGIGTERVEEDLQILFPDAVVARMDLDSTMQKNQYLELLNDFQQRRIDILVGTQMVTKGLDFQNVSVVGIINADNIINYPNFRSFERAFQQMTQVSGRAGRHGNSGRVIIQTFNPQHQVIGNVVDHDYTNLYNEQIQERRVFRYPPFYRMIQITLKHRDADVLNAAAEWLAKALRSAFAWRVMGPEYPLVARVRALYLKQIMLRFEKSEPISDAKRVIMQMAADLTKQEGWSGVAVVFDVDPY